MRKKTLLTLVTIAALATSGNAAVLALFGFDTYDGTSPVSPESGTQSGTATLTTASGPGGTTFSAQVGNPTLALGVGNGLAANGSTFTILVNGTGFTDFMVSYDVKKGGVDSFAWQWSTDGSTFATIQFASPGTGSGFNSTTINFSGVTAINNAPAVYLRNSMTGATGQNGRTDFDNIQVSAVPEPINVALALFGLAFVGLRFGRRVLSFVCK